MASEDGGEGIKLSDFFKMWTEDGTRLVKQEKRILDGKIWYLYAVYFPKSTDSYGRHMAMILKVDRKTSVIELHDLINLAGEVGANHRQGIDDWFERHAGKY